MKLFLILFCAFNLASCSKDSDDSAKSGKKADAARGRAIYLANCVACHNNDPSRDGPVGPAIQGSSKELVLSTSYPPGYKPKRPTKVMPQFPYLKNEIPHLAAYLAN